MYLSPKVKEELSELQNSVMRYVDYEKRPYRIGTFEASRRMSLRVNEVFRKKRASPNPNPNLESPSPQRQQFNPNKVIATGGFSKVYLGVPTKKRKLSMFWHSLQRAIKVIKLGVETSQDEFTRDEEGNDTPVKRRYYRQNRKFELEFVKVVDLDPNSGEPIVTNGKPVISNKAGKWMTRLEVLEELRLLRMVQHAKHVVKLYDSFETTYEDANQAWCVMEWLPSSLERMLWLAQDEPIPKDISKNVLEGVLKALIHLKRHRVVHCDIKPGNILFSNTGHVKLCDFGLAIEIPQESEFYSTDEAGYTPLYAPPELTMQKAEFNHAADIWSFGCLVYQLFVAHTGLYGHIDDVAEKRFSHALWDSYEVSDEVYLYNMNGPSSFGLMDNSQRKKVCEHMGELHSEEPKWEAKYKELVEDDMHSVIRRTLTPYKSRNVVDVKREGVFQRPSAEELLESGVFDTKVGELRKRNALMETVKHTEALLKKISAEQREGLRKPMNLSGVTQETIGTSLEGLGAGTHVSL